MALRPHPLCAGSALALLAACSGASSCGGCAGLAPLPGGFPDDRQIDRAVEIKLSTEGLAFIGREFSNLVAAYARMDCGPGEPVPCPTQFVVGGQREASACSAAGVCVRTTTGEPEPVVGFEIEQAAQSGAVVCRDDLSDPNARRCFAWLRLEGLAARPQPPNQLVLDVQAQLYSTPIPLRFDGLGMDCLVTLDSNAQSSAFQTFTLTASLDTYRGAGVQPNGQLDVRVVDLVANIPDGNIRIEADPVHGNVADSLLCGIANLGRIKTALVGRLVGTLADVVDEQLDAALGSRCFTSADCATGATCDAKNFCVDAAGGVVPTRLGAEGRARLDQLLSGLPVRGGDADVSALVGGTTPRTDAAGATLPVRVGLEAAGAPSTCVPPGLSPRARPGWVPPAGMELADRVDLDFDGTPERSYMLAAGLSRAVVEQALWGAYQSGLFCAQITSADTELLNTGALAVLMPSLSKLTHADRFAWAIAPARVRVRPGGAPEVIFGPGRTTGASPNVTLTDPLISLRLPDLELRFGALVEERWVHLMTITADVELPLGLFAEPTGDLRPLLGDVSRLVTDVRVRDAEMLAETPAELEAAVPTLLSIVLPQLSGSLIQPIALPQGAELGGFTPTFVGARGIADALGRYEHAGLFFDLAFDRRLAAPRVRFVETAATVVRRVVPSARAMSVKNPGGPELPELVLALGGAAGAGAALEHQLRVDGGPWSPFVREPELALRRAEFLVQGRHVVEVRARIRDDANSIDPTPERVEFVVDAEAPHLEVRRVAGEAALVVRAFDAVAGEAIDARVVVDGVATPFAARAEGVELAVPALADLERAVAVEATDPSGHVARVEVQPRGGSIASGGEAGVSDPPAPSCAASGGAPCVFALFALVAVLRAPRRRR
jgi:hypothetical protein